jgi:ribosomal protein L37E
LSGGVKPTTAEERRWLKKLRLQQRGQVFFVVGFVGLLLLAIPAQGILRRFRILGAILSVAALCSWIGALVFSMWVGGKMLSEQNRRCPRCGNSFFRTKWGIYLSTSNRCFSCGFPTPDDLNSLRA